jgi:hypothetical protein
MIMKEFKSTMREIMNMAWSMVRMYGYTISKAMHIAWLNIKLKMQLKNKIVEFYYQKVDGSVRQAFGTLKENIVPQTQGVRRSAESCQVYYDTEKQEWRCYKKCNLIKIEY